MKILNITRTTNVASRCVPKNIFDVFSKLRKLPINGRKTAKNVAVQQCRSKIVPKMKKSPTVPKFMIFGTVEHFHFRTVDCPPKNRLKKKLNC